MAPIQYPSVLYDATTGHAVTVATAAVTLPTRYGVTPTAGLSVPSTPASATPVLTDPVVPTSTALPIAVETGMGKKIVAGRILRRAGTGFLAQD